MTDHTPVLRARTAPAQPPAAREAHDVRMAQAVAIARAANMLPKSYASQPGAVLLAIDWAEHRGVSIMDAIHGVAWVQGRPVIDATLQRALAANAGYRVLVESADRDAATVAVSTASGELLGRATYSMRDAQDAGLAGKDNWRKNPVDMLVARASTRAIKWFCPGVLTGGAITSDEVDTLGEHDAVAVLDPQPSGGEEVEAQAHHSPPAPVDAPTSPPADTILDAELVDDGPADAMARGQAKAAVDGAKGDGRYPVLAEAMQAEGIGLVASKWTQGQALRIVALAAELPESGPDAA